jgi:hypothetical protein
LAWFVIKATLNFMGLFMADLLLDFLMAGKSGWG